MEKQFCPSCGNNTLIRTSCSTDADGNMVLYLKQNFQYNKRGTQYAIPAPKGGRHGDGIILREDQKEYGRALAAHRKQKNSIDPFDVDFVPLEGLSKPRASKPMIGFGRRNVNETRRARK